MKREPVNIRQLVQVTIGNGGTLVGDLTYVKQGARENTSFVYDAAWLARDDRFAISPDLELTAHEEVTEALARRLKDAVRDATGLSCSIGVAPNKLLAKIA